MKPGVGRFFVNTSILVGLEIFSKLGENRINCEGGGGVKTSIKWDGFPSGKVSFNFFSLLVEI